MKTFALIFLLMHSYVSCFSMERMLISSFIFIATLIFWSMCLSKWNISIAVISRFIWEKWLLQPTSVEAICAKIEVNLVDNLNSVAFKNERYLVASSLEWWMDVSLQKWMVEHIQCTSSWNDANTKHIVLTRKPNFEKKIH